MSRREIAGFTCEEVNGPGADVSYALTLLGAENDGPGPWAIVIGYAGRDVRIPVKGERARALFAELCASALEAVNK